jgi:hypothetical protein
MNFFMVVLVAGELAGVFGPGPRQAYSFDSKARCEEVRAEVIAKSAPPPDYTVQCVDEKTFDKLVKSTGV